jgi:cytochrome c oxidase cbb3-type subunit 3
VVLFLALGCTAPASQPQQGIDTAQVVASASLANPLAGNAEAAKSGEGLFASMNCDGCHGGGGLGFVGPNLVDGRWRFGGSDGEVFRSISAGRAQGMPAYGKLLSESTIWQLVTYIKSQPVPVDIATEAWP